MSVSVSGSLGGSWIVVPSLPSWFHYRSMAPALTLYERVFIFTSPYTCTLRPLSPWIPLCLASQVTSAPAGGRTESPDRALHIPVSYDLRRVCLFSLVVHQAWCRSHCLQQIHNCPQQSWSAQILPSKQRLWAHRWYFCAAYLFLLLSPLGTPCPCLLTMWPYVWTARWLGLSPVFLVTFLVGSCYCQSTSLFVELVARTPMDFYRQNSWQRCHPQLELMENV